VRLGHRGDDREPEPDTAARTRTRRVCSVEALEDVLEMLRVEPWPRVVHRDLRSAVQAAQRHLDRRVRRCVGPDVRQQVVHDLAEPDAIADHRDRLGRQVDLPPRLDGVRRLDRLAHDLVERDRNPLERPPVVEAGKEQQVVDEHAHPLGLAADPRHRTLEVGRPLRGAAVVQLRVRAHGRERSAHFV
jgi:hypothetical protein